MSERKQNKARQHEPVRTPNNWNGQERDLITQLNRIFDDVYKNIGLLEQRLKAVEEENEE